MKRYLTCGLPRLTLPMSLVFCISIACGAEGVTVVPNALADNRVFYTASDFEVTETELQQYMGVEMAPDGSVVWGSPLKVQVALNELYVLKVLSRSAMQRGVLTDREQEWIAYYAVALAATRKLVTAIVEEQMESVDWSSEAQEYYVANRSEFQMKEAISVRTLLIRTDNRNALEALTLAGELTASDMSIEQFESIVRQHSEDPNSEDGKIPKLTKGMTVREFEEAAFSLEEIGQISEPVLSMYGAHVIQLLGREPTRYSSLESVEKQVIAALKEKRFTQFSNFAKTEPRRDPPDDVVVRQEQIDQFLEQVAAQYEASRPQLPTP